MTVIDKRLEFQRRRILAKVARITARWAEIRAWLLKQANGKD